MARPLSNGIPPKGEPKVEPEPKGVAELKTVAVPNGREKRVRYLNP